MTMYIKETMTLSRYLVFGLFLCHVFVIERSRNCFIEYDQHFILVLFLPISGFLLAKALEPGSSNFSISVPLLIGILLAVQLSTQAVSLDFIDMQNVFCCYALLAFYFVLSTFRNEQYLLIGTFLCLSIVSIIFMLSGLSLTPESDPLRGEINEAENSNYLASLAPFALSCAWSYRNFPKLAFLGLIAVFTISYTLYVEGSRTSYIAALLGIFFVVGTELKRVNFVNWKKKKGIWIGLGVFIALSTGILVYHLYLSNKDSVGGRFLIYKASVPMLVESPILGIGIQRFKDVYNNYQAAYIAANQPPVREQLLADDTFYAFNEYIQIGIELGIVGLLLFFATIFYLGRFFIAHLRQFEQSVLGTGATASLIAILICCFSSYPLRSSSILVNAIFFFAVISFNSPSGQEIQFGILRKKVRVMIAVAITLVAMLALVAQFKRFKAKENWRIAAGMALTGSFDAARKHYELATPVLANDGNFLFNYGAELHLAGFQIEGLGFLRKSKRIISHTNLNIYLGETLQALRQADSAVQHYTTASLIVPSRYLPKYLLFELYRDEGNLPAARIMAQDIIGYPVKIPSPDVTIYKQKAKDFLAR